MPLENTVAAFVGTLEVLRPVFTQPTFANFVPIVLGWLLTPGRHAVTAALVVTGLSAKRHHSAFHRFFSQAKWEPDEIGHRLFMLLLRFVTDEAPIPLAVDDTLASKKGAHVFGIGSHLDAVRSTKNMRIFCFGHVWVTLCVVIQLPFCRRPWALPVLFRLYRNKKECAKKGHPYKKKTELAREMLDVVAGWANGRRVEVAADSAYCNDTVTRGLAPNIVLFGTMRPDAVLTALPKTRGNMKGGRPRKRGRELPKPKAVAKDPHKPWETLTAMLYREQREVAYKQMQAQWYRACGARLLKIVITQVTTGNIPFRVFFCTDPKVTVRYLLERYSSRWAIEVTFFDLKQFLGFADSQAWSRRAVERTAPLVGLLFTVVVIWYAESARGSVLDFIPIRPWYRNKAAPSFADMLGAAQRAAILSGVFDPASNSNNLHNHTLPDVQAFKRAA